MGKSLIGLCSFFGACTIMFFVTFFSGVFEFLPNDLLRLITGDALTIQPLEVNRFNIVLIGLSCAACAAPPNLLIGLSILFFNEDTMKSHQMVQLFTNDKKKSHSGLFVINVFTEELPVRWLLLGVVTQVPFFSGKGWFYVLFLTGNFIWAAIHLRHLPKEDRRLFFVLPQWAV